MKLRKFKMSFRVLSITICLSLMLSITAFAVPENELILYDGVAFESEEAIEKYKELDDAQKNVFRENSDLIVLSISEEVVCEIPAENSFSRAVMDPSRITGRISVSSNSQRTKYYIYLYVDWLTESESVYGDKIAVSWAGGSAILNSQCYHKDGNGYATDSTMLLSDVGPNAFVSYELNAFYSGYYLCVQISEANESGLHNIVGGYAHKTSGVTGVTVGVDSSNALSFTAGFGTVFNTMSPVYTSSYLS